MGVGPEPGGTDGGRCVIVSIRNDVGEVTALAETLGLEVVEIEVQRRDRPDPRTYIGRGKAEEVGDRVKETGADLVVVDDELKPSQVHNLQSSVDVEVYDRIRLILEIFTRRARSPEARLQVELATLRHRIPFVKETINLLKKGERPGLLAGGEVGTHQYLREIRQRMSRIQRELDDIRRVRGVRRKHRRRRSFVTVSIAGYTNAGKTSALNMLTEAGAEVDSRYFSTLSPLSRSVEGIEGRVLINDTVGFIEDLPPWMVEAFESTLEEVYDSDLVMLVLDASEEGEVLERKLRTSLDIIKRDGREMPILFLLNKVDMLAPSELKVRVELLRASGLMTASWLPVQLNVRRPKGREAMRGSLFTAIIENLEDISLLEIRFSDDVNPFEVMIGEDESDQTLMNLLRERAIFIDLAGRESGRVTIAIDNDYIVRIKEIVDGLNAVEYKLINKNDELL